METTPAIDLKTAKRTNRQWLVPLPPDANGIVSTAAVHTRPQAEALARLLAIATQEHLIKAGFLREAK